MAASPQTSESGFRSAGKSGRRAATVLTSLTRGRPASGVSQVAGTATTGSAAGGRARVLAASCSGGTEQTLAVRMRGSHDSAPASKCDAGSLARGTAISTQRRGMPKQSRDGKKPYTRVHVRDEKTASPS